jgi:predicted O-methyltransferase YrrM
MSLQDSPGKIYAYVSKLSKEDRLLRKIREESNRHRARHGCDVHPSDPATGRLLGVLVGATRARRVLEVGCGLGYSAIWLAQALPPGGRVDTIERDPLHSRMARRNLKAARVERRVCILNGEAGTVLSKLRGPYDFIFEDAAFGQRPEYFEDLIRVLKVGGCIHFANWFPIEPAIVGGKQLQKWKRDFPDSKEAPEATRRFVEEVLRDPRLSGVLLFSPWHGIVTKISN